MDPENLKNLYALGLNAYADADLNADEVPQLEGYEIEKRLGRGGMGVVYLARNLRLKRAVAIKVLHASADSIEAERLQREGEVLAQLSHPHIVGVHDLLVDQYGRPNLILEYVQGGDLAQRLNAGALSHQQAMAVFESIVSAVRHAHANGVLHRDLKPANILFDAQGTLKVADFGLAALSGSPVTHQLTLSGTTAGTEAYMSPEQKNAQPLDTRSDIYSLGVILYELHTGRRPQGVFAPLPDKILDQVVRRCMQERAEDRYADCDALLEALGGETKRPQAKALMMAAVALLLFFAAWMLRDRIYPADRAPGENPTSAHPLDPPAGPSVPVEQGEVDLLERMADRFSSLRRLGSWRLEGGHLVTTRGQTSQAWIEIPFDPGDSYDIEWVATRVTGEDSMPLIFPTVAGTVCLELDAWRMGIAGFQNVDGQDLRQPGRSFPFRYRNGVACHVLLQVRPDVVILTVDGQERQRLGLAGRRLSVSDIWQLPADIDFAVGAWEADTRFERLIWKSVE